MSNRNRKQQLSSSSDEEQEQTKELSSKRRQSDRIQRKQKRPAFHLPSRQKVWDAIPSETSSSKRFSPRKTVNNFTKVYNTYNFDDYEDTSDDEGEKFDIESSENSDDNTASNNKKAETNHRIKNYHRRIKVESSSSDEEVNTTAKSGSCEEDKDKAAVSNVTNEESKDSNCDKKTSKSMVSSRDENSKENEGDWQHHCNEVNDNSSGDEVVPFKRSRNVSVLVSDDETEDAGAEKNNNVVPPAADMEPAVENKDLASSVDDLLDDASSEDENESRSARLKRKSKDLFQQFKDAQAKRKLSFGKSSSTGI